MTAAQRYASALACWRKRLPRHAGTTEYWVRYNPLTYKTTFIAVMLKRQGKIARQGTETAWREMGAHTW